MIDTIERHPLEPFLPGHARLLMLGSFPPPRARWSMDFYYPNLQNDMWRLYGLLFFGDKDYFLKEGKKSFDKERLITFLEEKGIALFDTAMEVIRHKGNASDQFLEVVTPLDLKGVLDRIPGCCAIVTTGQKATDTLLEQIEAVSPRVGGYSEFMYDGRPMRLYRMPSSSRAYPKPLEEKAADYRVMFHDLEMLQGYENTVVYRGYAKRLLLARKGEWIDKIILTLDQRHVMDIAHLAYWRNAAGEHPAPFTTISWWDVLFEAVVRWARRGRYYETVEKGLHPGTEFFGAFRANVPVTSEPETTFNKKLKEEMERYDTIWLAGEARTHCVANTLKQLFDFPEIIRKMVILEDCMSDIPGYEELAVPIYDKAARLGARFAKSDALLFK